MQSMRNRSLSSASRLNAPRRGRVAFGRMSCAATATKEVSFAKYQGLGNDFVMVDNRHSKEPMITPEQAVKVCDRNFGIGADGVIFALPPEGDTQLTMRIFNADGSEPEMCGNGIRCLARFIADRDGSASSETYRIHTLAGVIQPQLLADGQVCVDMGEPILEAASVPTRLAPTQGSTVVQQGLEVEGRTYQVTCVSMGNPHAIIYSVDQQPLQVDEVDLCRLGPQFESHPVFPARTNTEFVEVLSPEHVRMIVWERGSGRTLACGTGACAVVVAGVLEGRLQRNCRVDLPGGPLQIEWRESNNKIYMTGPAELVFTGSLSV